MEDNFVLEVAGKKGAGKSTVWAAVQKVLAERGHDSSPVKFSGDDDGRFIHVGLWRLLSEPTFLVRTLRFVRQAEPPSWSRRRALREMLTQCARMLHIQRAPGCHVIDQGLLNLFRSLATPQRWTDDPTLARAARGLPLPDVAVFLYADLAERHKRVALRSKEGIITVSPVQVRRWLRERADEQFRNGENRDAVHQVLQRLNEMISGGGVPGAELRAIVEASHRSSSASRANRPGRGVKKVNSLLADALRSAGIAVDLVVLDNTRPECLDENARLVADILIENCPH